MTLEQVIDHCQVVFDDIKIPLCQFFSIAHAYFSEKFTGGRIADGRVVL